MMDYHKLLLHPQRVAEWLETGDCWPIYAEIGSSGRCNHRCQFCSFSYTGYSGGLLDWKAAIKALQDMAKGGLKAVMFAGEGEPLLHERLDTMVYAAKEAGLDVAVTTNGTLLTRKLADRLIPFLSWIRFSVNAGDPETYATVHGVSPREFALALAAIRYAVDAAKGGSCTVGVQSVLWPGTEGGLPRLAEKVRTLGVDYYSVKPFTGHPMGQDHGRVKYVDTAALKELVNGLATERFAVEWRAAAFNDRDVTRPYFQCYGHPFMSCIAASGDVYLCSNFLGQAAWSFGNIGKEAFADIWQGAKRKSVLKRLEALGITGCRQICRLDQCNRYLWRLKNPEKDDNFI